MSAHDTTLVVFGVVVMVFAGMGVGGLPASSARKATTTMYHVSWLAAAERDLSEERHEWHLSTHCKAFVVAVAPRL